MELYTSAWHVLVIFVIFFSGLFFTLKFSKIFHCNWRRGAVLYCWHTLFCIVYANYVITNGGDALGYYESSILSEADLSLGTLAIVFFTRLFSYYLEFSLLGVFLLYNIFGVIGLMAFDASLRYASRDKTKFVRNMATLIIFLPSVSFWSAAIGKDAISFMAVGLALWAAIDFNQRLRLMIISIILMLMVRPHMAGLMIIAVAGSLMLREKLSIAKKTVLVVFSLAAVVVAVPFALEYSGLGAATGINDFQEYVVQRQGYNQDGGGGIDISAMSPPMQFFTYLFRPLPFEARTIFAFAASIDNVILLMIFALGVRGFFGYRKHIRNSTSENIAFMWIYAVSAWLILAITTSNLGISVRQKWMFVPILIFLLISMTKTRKQVGRRVNYRSKIDRPSDATINK